MKFVNFRRLVAACLTSANAYADSLAAAVGNAVILKGAWDASAGFQHQSD